MPPAGDGRQGEIANGRFGASKFVNPSFADWPLSGNRYGYFGHRALTDPYKFATKLLPLNSGAG